MNEGINKFISRLGIIIYIQKKSLRFEKLSNLYNIKQFICLLFYIVFQCELLRYILGGCSIRFGKQNVYWILVYMYRFG